MPKIADHCRKMTVPAAKVHRASRKLINCEPNKKTNKAAADVDAGWVLVDEKWMGEDDEEDLDPDQIVYLAGDQPLSDMQHPADDAGPDDDENEEALSDFEVVSVAEAEDLPGAPGDDFEPFEVISVSDDDKEADADHLHLDPGEDIREILHADVLDSTVSVGPREVDNDQDLDEQFTDLDTLDPITRFNIIAEMLERATKSSECNGVDLDASSPREDPASTLCGITYKQ